MLFFIALNSDVEKPEQSSDKQGVTFFDTYLKSFLSRSEKKSEISSA